MTHNTRLAVGRITMAAIATILGTVPVFAQTPFDPDLYTIDSNGEPTCLAGFDRPEPPPRPVSGRTEATLLRSYPNFDYWNVCSKSSVKFSQ